MKAVPRARAAASKPCIRNAHCNPTSAPLMEGSSNKLSAMASAGQTIICIHIGGANVISTANTEPTTMWPTMSMVK